MSSLPPLPLPLRSVESLLERLDTGDDPRQIKDDLAALVLRFLDMYHETLSARQRLHLVNAIGTLSIKRGSGKRMSTSDLRIALLDLQKAVTVTDPGASSEPRPLQKPINHLISVDMLRHALLNSLQRVAKPQSHAANRHE